MLYKEKEQESEKRWAMQVRELDTGIEMNAVDADTGETLAFILEIIENEGCVVFGDMTDALSGEGYDPFQYGNIWDEQGHLKMIR